MFPKFSTSKLTKLITITIICVSLIFFSSKNFFAPVHSLFLRLAYPFQKSFYTASSSIRETFEFLGGIGSLKNENKNLVQENAKLISQVAKLQDQKNENDYLRRQFELVPRDKYNLEAAMVIGRDPQGPGSWILIGKGNGDGIKKDMPVIVSDGILLGKVSEVYEKSSKIILLTDSASSVNVTDLETGAVGILKGEYGLGMSMDMVEQTDILNEGDTIITSGLGGSLPRGFLTGKVRQVNRSADKLFQQASVIPQIKYSKLSVVFVVR